MATAKKQKNETSTPTRAATDYSIDISMLIDNLNRTPAERIKRHQAALNAAEKLRKAKHTRISHIKVAYPITDLIVYILQNGFN